MNEGQGGLASGGIYSTPVQEYGDIVIRNSKPKKRWKKWAIGGVVVVLIGLIAFLVYYIYCINSNSNEKIIKILSSEDEQKFSNLERLYYNAFYGEITLDEIFGENKRNLLINNTDAAIRLKNEIGRINVRFVDGKIRSDFIEVEELLDVRVDEYARTLELYKNLYEAYAEDDVGILNQYLGEESSEFVVAERFRRYIDKKLSLTKSMQESGCDSKEETGECIYLSEEYVANDDSLKNSATIVQAVFAMYSDVVYTDEALIYSRIQNILYKLGSEQ